jgi:hypothetical protein
MRGVIGVKLTDDETCTGGCGRAAVVIVDMGHQQPNSVLCQDCTPEDLQAQAIFQEAAWWRAPLVN